MKSNERQVDDGRCQYQSMKQPRKLNDRHHHKCRWMLKTWFLNLRSCIIVLQSTLCLKKVPIIKQSVTLSNLSRFLPRCMECSRGIAMGFLSVRLSVCPSVCLSNACIVTKRKKAMFRFFISYERTFILVF